MSVTREELLKLSGGDMVGGNVVVYHGGRHQILGRSYRGMFTLTDEGEAFLETAATAAVVKAKKTRAKPAPDAPATPEADLDAMLDTEDE